jgi:hypothetical protein
VKHVLLLADRGQRPGLTFYFSQTSLTILRAPLHLYIGSIFALESMNTCKGHGGVAVDYVRRLIDLGSSSLLAALLSDTSG